MARDIAIDAGEHRYRQMDTDEQAEQAGGQVTNREVLV